MEQAERARRYLERVRNAYAGVPYRDDGREYYGDDIYTFFVHCHHIGDWIVALSLVGVTQKQVSALIDSHIELRICADLCNGAKHCKLTRRTRLDSQPHVATARLTSLGVFRAVELPSGETELTGGTSQCEFTVLADGESYDALDLAEACMSLWDDFIAQIGVTS